MYVGENTIRVVPSLVFDDGTPPFKSFLVTRVLEGMRASDLASGKSEAEAPPLTIAYTSLNTMYNTMRGGYNYVVFKDTNDEYRCTLRAWTRKFTELGKRS